MHNLINLLHSGSSSRIKGAGKEGHIMWMTTLEIAVRCSCGSRPAKWQWGIFCCVWQKVFDKQKPKQSLMCCLQESTLAALKFMDTTHFLVSWELVTFLPTMGDVSNELFLGRVVLVWLVDSKKPTGLILCPNPRLARSDQTFPFIPQAQASLVVWDTMSFNPFLLIIRMLRITTIHVHNRFLSFKPLIIRHVWF